MKKHDRDFNASKNILKQKKNIKVGNLKNRDTKND